MTHIANHPVLASRSPYKQLGDKHTDKHLAESIFAHAVHALVEPTKQIGCLEKNDILLLVPGARDASHIETAFPDMQSSVPAS